MPKNRRSAIPVDAHFVQFVHDHVVSRVWPSADTLPKGGCRDRGLLESAVNRPFQSAFGKDAYPEVIAKAAALFHSLVANHSFIDGNKRTAVMVLQSFLVLNGITPLLTNEQIYNLARETASHSDRGVSPPQVYDEIFGVLKQKTITFSKVRKISLEKPEIRVLYNELLENRRAIKESLKALAVLRQSAQSILNE